MSNQPAPTPRDRELDEALAAFADRARSGDPKVESMPSSDPELQALEKMVVRLNRAVGHTDPGAALARRIRSTLEVEWHRQRTTTQPGMGWRSGLQNLRRPLMATAAVVTVLVVVLLALPLIWPGGNLAGSAGGAANNSGIIVPVLVGGIIIVAAVAWWINRRKR